MNHKEISLLNKLNKYLEVRKTLTITGTVEDCGEKMKGRGGVYWPH